MVKFLLYHTSLSRIAFPGIFFTVCFLIILLLSKQTAPTKKKLTKQKEKYKRCPKINPTFFILHCSLLMIFLVLLSNETKQPKGTSIPYNCIENSRIFSMNLLEILDITYHNSFRCQLSYFALTNIQLHKYSFFRFILLLLGAININLGQTTLNNNEIITKSL